VKRFIRNLLVYWNCHPWITRRRAKWSPEREAAFKMPQLIGGALDGHHYNRGNGEFQATVERGCIYVWDDRRGNWYFSRKVDERDTEQRLNEICFGAYVFRGK
jgi:hypothetical protein